jgi:hypothetical protein
VATKANGYTKNRFNIQPDTGSIQVKLRGFWWGNNKLLGVKRQEAKLMLT